MRELWKLNGRDGSVFVFANIAFELVQVRIDASNEEAAWKILSEHVKDDVAGIYFTEQESKYIKSLLLGDQLDNEETKKRILDKMTKRGIVI